MLKNYFQIACKVYLKRKLFTAINLLCIVLTLVVLMSVTAILQTSFYPKGVEGRSDRFLQVTNMHQTKHNSFSHGPLGYKVIDQYMRKMKTPELVAAVTSPDAVSVYQSQRVVELMMRRADANYWKILDFKILAGRIPNAEDVQQGRFVAVLNQSSARKLFASDNPIGQTINTGMQQFEVIGVVEDVLHLNAYADLWVPVTTFPSSDYLQQFSGEFSALLMGQSSADLAKIKQELLQIASQVNADSPEHWEETYLWADSKIDFFARTLLDNAQKENSGAEILVTGIMVAMLLFMLLPALNLVNLNSARIMERASEIGVRKAFGASVQQLVFQFVIENIVLCLVAGALGIMLTQLLLMYLNQSGLIPYMQVSIDLMVIAYGLILSMVFGILSGVIPAWKMARIDPVFALKGGA